MAFLSQASPLGSLLLPHDAFQEYAAHPAEWSAALSSKGSESTCILSGLTTFLHCAFTAHSYLVVTPDACAAPLPLGRYPPIVGQQQHRPSDLRMTHAQHYPPDP